MSFLKNMVFRKMLQSKMKDVPEEQREQFFKMFEENPELFQKIAEEVQEEIKKGKDQMSATMEVIQRHQSELQKISQNK